MVFSAYKLCSGGDFFVVCKVGAAKNNAVGVLYLITEKFAEIFHIHLAFHGINHGGGAI